LTEPSLTSEQPPARSWREVLRVYTQLPTLPVLLLGFSSGLPNSLALSTLSTWLAQAHIDKAAIGMLSWVSVFYSVKYVWSPIVDRMPLPILHRLLGRRRSWMLLAQVGIAVGLVCLSASDPAVGIRSFALSALLMAFCGATQDIALDAWRIESAPVELQGTVAGVYQAGYRLAVIVSTFGALEIASAAGWHASYLAMAACACVGIVTTTLLAREPAATMTRDEAEREERVVLWLERKAHWPSTLKKIGEWFIGAVVCPLVDFFGRKGLGLALLTLAFVGTYRLTEFTMGPMAQPFYIDHGYTLSQIATVVKLYGIAAGIVGVLIASAVMARLGLVRSLVLGSLMVMASNLGFAALATTSMHPPTLLGLGLINAFDNLALAVHGTAMIAYLSSLTSPRYTATQYALFSSLYSLPGTILKGFSGFIVNHTGFPLFFTYTASMSIPGLILLFFLVRKQAQTAATQPHLAA
jgi:PAT family beta-lactamase induction signal transducer AmpG